MFTSSEKEKRMTIKGQIPDGLGIGKCSYGNSVVATKKHSKGSLIYSYYSKIILNEDFDIDLFIDDKKLEMNSIVHSVSISPTKRILYLFDIFMNHSCDPNSFSVGTDFESINYDTFALKDIEAGDEITCDYNLFEYDCRDKKIEKCACGAKDCIGRVHGFKYLTTEQKRAKIQQVESYIFYEMLRDSDIPNNFIYDEKLKIPENVEIISNSESETFSLIAKENFEKGEIIYKNTSRFVPKDCMIIIELLGNRIWVDNNQQLLDRGEGEREYLGFDTFRVNFGEEERNTIQIYQDSTNYDVVATKQIKMGEKLFG